MQIKSMGTTGNLCSRILPSRTLSAESGELPALPSNGMRNMRAIENCLLPNQEQRLQEAALMVRQSFPGVDFSFTGFADESILRGYAQASGGGLHMAVSPDFLDWMIQDPDSFQEGLDFLSSIYKELACHVSRMPNAYGAGAVIGENGEVTFWTSYWEKEENPVQQLLDHLEEMREEQRRKEQERQKAKTKKLIMMKKIGYSPNRDLSRLARVSTVAEVKKLISKVYARKASIGGNSSYDKEEVRMTVGQMENVIRRARTKVKNLEEETTMEIARKKAEKRKQVERSLRIRLELKKKRTARRSREYAQAHEKSRWVPDFLRPRSPEEERLEQEQRSAELAERGMAPIATADPAQAIPGEAQVAVGEPAAQAVAVVNAGIAAGGTVNIVV